MSFPFRRRGNSTLFALVATLSVLSLAAGILVAYPMKLVNIATQNISWWLK